MTFSPDYVTIYLPKPTPPIYERIEITMKINKTTENNTIILAVEGRIDTTTAPQLEAEVKSSAESAECIVIDFSNVEYISSAGLRVLLSGHKLMNAKGGLKLINVSEDIMEIFDVTGFTDILNIE